MRRARPWMTRVVQNMSTSPGSDSKMFGSLSSSSVGAILLCSSIKVTSPPPTIGRHRRPRFRFGVRGNGDIATIANVRPTLREDDEVLESDDGASRAPPSLACQRLPNTPLRGLPKRAGETLSYSTTRSTTAPPITFFKVAAERADASNSFPLYGVSRNNAPLTRGFDSSARRQTDPRAPPLFYRSALKWPRHDFVPSIDRSISLPHAQIKKIRRILDKDDRCSDPMSPGPQPSARPW